MTGGKGREASAPETSKEGDEDLQQEQIVRPDVDKRKDDKSLGFMICNINEAICDCEQFIHILAITVIMICLMLPPCR
jgi:hypothetical protein